MESNDLVERELSYYGWWLIKEMWPASRAIRFVIDYNMLHRSWNVNENYSNIVKLFEDELVNKMLEENASEIFSQRVIIKAEADEYGFNTVHRLDIYECYVWPRKFLTWLHAKGYKMPYEFEAYIGVPEKYNRMTKRLEDQISKEVIQGIGQTLWLMYPNMDIEEMVDHQAIRVIGNGRSYDRDTTVRRWLSEFDPRTNKRGRKKSKI